MKMKPSVKVFWLVKVFIPAVVVAAAGITAYQIYYSPHTNLELLPDPDLAGVEIRVTEKLQDLRSKIEKNSQSHYAWGKLGMTFHVHDFKHEAIQCYEQAAALNQNEFRWPYYSAILLHNMGNPEALEWFERSRKLKSSYAPLLVLQGRALFDVGNLKESSRAFNRALETEQKPAHAYLGLAEIELSQNNLQRCRQFLLKALEIDPRHGEAHGLLSAVYRRLNEPEKAGQELQIARGLPILTPMIDLVYEELMMEGVSAYWYRERGLVYLARNLIADAIHEFQMALKIRPNSQGYDHVGELLQQLQKHAAAAASFHRAIELNPSNLKAYINLGTALNEMGQIDQASIWVERALRLNPSFPDGYITLGTIYTRGGRTIEAIATYRRGLRHFPEHQFISSRLAWLLATSPQVTLRNGVEALRLAKSVCEKTNYRNPQMLDILAAAYAETGNFDKAVKVARQAHQLALIEQRSDFIDPDQIQSRLKLYKLKQPYREKRFPREISNVQ